ncbi:S1/P1 nuclease [Verrucomicrobiota bacterium sgz303538]
MKLAIWIVALAYSLVSISSALSWDDTGHQVVAAIAWSQLSPEAQRKVILLFPDDPKSREHIIFTPSKKQGTPEDPYPHTVYNRITVANWMDDLRDNSYDKPLGQWHYVDRPFFDGIEPKLAVPESPNAREKIIEMINSLQRLRNVKAGKEYSEDRSKAAYALATLYHLVGDVHQPLHCVSRYSPGLENGDAGGNFFKIGPKDSDKLHSYWDAAGGLFDFVKLGREFDADSQQKLDEYTQRVLQRWDAQLHPDWKNYSPEEWVEESFQIAKRDVYSGVKHNERPGQEYQNKVQQIAAERIATAGYRLAAVLNQIFAQP